MENKNYDTEMMKFFAMSDVGLTEDEAELAVEDFIRNNEQNYDKI